MLQRQTAICAFSSKEDTNLVAMVCVILLIYSLEIRLQLSGLKKRSFLHIKEGN